MTFIVLKFIHVALMFMGVALAIGPAAMVLMVVRSHDTVAVRRALGPAERLFQVSTACYGLGIVFGVAAALSGAIDLTAQWLITAYVLVGLLGAHGILFDRWTKRIGRAMGGGLPPSDEDRVVATRMPAYLLTAMFALVILIVYVMVTKITLF